jgi:hypothetical protein
VPSIRGLDIKGQTIFTTPLPGVDINTVERLIVTKDKCLSLIGSGLNCDLMFSPVNRNFLIKMDTNGLIKFQSIIQPYSERFVDLTQHSDSSYYIVSDSILYHYSKSGIFMSKLNTGLKGIKSAIFLNNGNLLISGRLNNVIKNIEMTTSAVIINQQNSGNLFSKFIQTPAGNIFGLTLANSLESITPNLNTISSSSTAINSNIKLQDFTTRNDTIFLTSYNSNSNTPSYIVSDQNFNILYQTPASTYKNIVPTGISISKNNKINIIAKGTSLIPGYLSFTSNYQFPFTGNFVSKQDIGVISFSVVSQSTPYQFSNGLTIQCNLNVTVKNFTNDTIKNFYLNHEGFYTFCQTVSLHKFYDTIILPNSTVNVKTGNFYIEISENRPDLCVYTTVPNSSNDIQVNNDGFCMSVAVILDITKKTTQDDVLKIFPNPFNGVMNFASDHEISKIEIYNASGSLIHENALKNKQYSFDSSEFPNGLYLLKIETEKSVIFKKVFKE